MIEKKQDPTLGNNKFFYFLSLASGISILLAGPVLGLLVVGYFADNYFQTSPVFIITGLLSGFIASIFNILKLLKTMK